MNLDYVQNNPWAVVMISALKGINVNEVIKWLVNKSEKKVKSPKKNNKNKSEILETL